MSLGIVLEEFQREINVGGCLWSMSGHVPEWHKRNLVTLAAKALYYRAKCLCACVGLSR